MALRVFRKSSFFAKISMEGPKGSSPFAFYAFYQLYSHLNPGKSSSLSLEDIRRRLYPDFRIDYNEKTSLFITWKKKSNKHHTIDINEENYILRGCIGTFAKMPIAHGIEKYSLIAALEDRRFSPIQKRELVDLKCSCNILGNFKTIFRGGGNPNGDIFDWELGKHGIELYFKHPKTGTTCSATFLPDVMPEQHWNKEDTFANLIEKAGYWGNISEVMDNFETYFIEVIRYEGKKSSITYEEFNKQLKDIEA
ncbi:BAH_G0050950.mRNA.1.CDS.1 [Saccharomyces cerevisiae]|nr:SX2_G0035060.mRNA.1.CDS.1 [Saccharomyces cerevisiae]CAI4770928.1 BAH_G0050950.mRNA.1.CDS.1 [Saccharomyces cerevisiae]CAI4771875.1 BAG_1a_G0050940.mRNA.1.CDS.1 [Saccharomyces cerevisiae]CAI7330829.1 BAG_1a_G0050940.mRNA.1.CDS.1 [Saccharomyces cerevisiae]CAI7332719.1 BAH_G0050950.mRNA.1.CDS.1 [Saccharomyces cerevisiae]